MTTGPDVQKYPVGMTTLAKPLPGVRYWRKAAIGLAGAE